MSASNCSVAGTTTGTEPRSDSQPFRPTGSYTNTRDVTPAGIPERVHGHGLRSPCADGLSSRVMTAEGASGEALLLTRSCTTGWADAIHGELWLFPGGLLRV